MLLIKDDKYMLNAEIKLPMTPTLSGPNKSTKTLPKMQNKHCKPYEIDPIQAA
jgi:hypothetical protein